MKPWSLEPARDFGRPLGERLKSLQRESGFLGAAARVLWWLFVRAYLALYHRLRVRGRDNLPHQAPFVLVANHSGHLDALTLAAALPMAMSGRVFALAAGDTFFTTLPSSAFAAIFMNALPIWRSKTRRDHLAALRERLIGERCIYLLFPEGTRSRDGAMGRFKPGLGALIAGAEVPVVPCHIAGAHAAFPPDARLPRPGKLILAIGRPLTFANLPNQPESWHEIAAAVEAAVRGLAAESATPQV
jgi:1-acyl-sn-glycerol-3-phosphate acyltransferase